MDHIWLCVLLWCSVAICTADDTSYSVTNALFRCGIRKRTGVQLIHHAPTAELGQWPWHAALYHGTTYKCGGTLIDQRHVLTAAHCVTGKHNKKVMSPSSISIHLGKNHLDEYPEHVQIGNVSQIEVHPGFTTNKNDIALVVLAEVVRYSDYVVPICIEGIQRARIEDLVGQRGWVAGFGTTEDASISKQLRTTLVPIVNNTECVQRDPQLFGHLISPAVFCAGDRNGTSVCTGDSGGGVYIHTGDHWKLRGITSFSGKLADGSCDVTNYAVFTNVAYYYEWIKKRTGLGGMSEAIPRRISELKCRQYSKFARKRPNGICYNSRSPHTVSIVDKTQRHIASGSIISEKFVLTTAPSLIDIFIAEADRDDLWVHLGNQPDKKVIRETFHPGYDPETLRHHIMLLELSSPLTFTNRFYAACLANSATENLYDTLLLNGYSGKSAVASTLHESVENRIISNEQCNATVKQNHRKYNVYGEDICTTDRYESRFYWSGIVGGPLQTVNTRSCTFTQIGVIKVLIPHGKDQKGTYRFTNAYDRVTAYLDWIERHVWANETVPDGVDFEDEVFEAPTDGDEYY